MMIMQSCDSKCDTAFASFAFVAAPNFSSMARTSSSTVAGEGDAGIVSCKGMRHNIIANENGLRPRMMSMRDLTRTSSAAATESEAENLLKYFSHKKCERTAGSRRLQRFVRP